MSEDLNFILKMKDDASAVLGQFNNNLKKTGTEANAMSGVFKEGAAAIGELAKKGIEAFALVEFAKKSTEAYGAYKGALAELGRATDLTDNALKEFGNEVIEANAKLPVMEAELLKVATIAAKIGDQSSEDIIKFTTTVARSSVLLKQSATEMALSLSRILSATGQKGADADPIADAMLRVKDKNRGDIEQIQKISEMIARSTGGAIKGTAVVGIAASMADLGGERAQMAVMTMTDMIDKMKDAFARGTPQASAFARVMGLTVSEAKKMSDKNVLQAYVRLMQGVVQLSKNGNALHTTMQALGGSSRQAMMGMVPLGNSVDKVVATVNQANDAQGNHVNALQRVQTASEKLGFAQGMLTTANEALAKSFGEETTKAQTAFTNALVAIIQFVTKLHNELPPVIKMLADMALAVLSVVAAMRAFSAILGVIGLTLSPWIILLTAVGAALLVIAGHWDQINDSIEKAIGMRIKFGETSIRDDNGQPIERAPKRITVTGGTVVGGPGSPDDISKGDFTAKGTDPKAEAFARSLREQAKTTRDLLALNEELNTSGQNYNRTLAVRTEILKQSAAYRKALGIGPEAAVPESVIKSITKLAEANYDLATKTQSASSAFNEFVENYKKTANDWGKTTKDLIGSITSGLETSMLSWITTGQANARQMVQTILSEIIKLAVIRPLLSSLLGPLGGMLGLGGSGSISLGGPDGPKPFAKGGVFSGGDVVPFADGGVVDRASFFPMKNGKTGMMGEAGTEAIMPLTRGPDGKLGVQANGGGGAGNHSYSSTIVVQPPSGGGAGGYDAAQHKAFGEMMDNTVRMTVLSVLEKESRPNGLLRGSVRRT